MELTLVTPMLNVLTLMEISRVLVKLDLVEMVIPVQVDTSQYFVFIFNVYLILVTEIVLFFPKQLQIDNSTYTSCDFLSNQ